VCADTFKSKRNEEERESVIKMKKPKSNQKIENLGIPRSEAASATNDSSHPQQWHCNSMSETHIHIILFPIHLFQTTK
jgi:hypothetical protein